MNIFDVLALVGTAVTAIGLAWTAYAVYREWAAVSGPTDYFIPTSVRRWLGLRVDAQVYAVTATSTSRGTDTAIFSRRFDSSLPTEVRLATLEAALTDIERSSQESSASIRSEMSVLKQSMDDIATAVTRIPAQAAEDERAKTIVNLRSAGWSLIVTTIGLVLQTPAAIWGGG